MINADKVRLMAELNLYEKTKGREALKLNNSVRHLRGTEGVKNVVYGIIAFILIAIIVIVSNYEEIKEVYHNIGLTLCIVGVIFVAAIFVVVYCIYSKHMLKHKHAKFDGNLWRYNFKKRKLRDILFADEPGDSKKAEVNTAK